MVVDAEGNDVPGGEAALGGAWTNFIEATAAAGQLDPPGSVATRHVILQQ